MFYNFIGAPWDGEMHEAAGFAQMTVQRRLPPSFISVLDFDPLRPVVPEAFITHETWLYDLQYNTRGPTFNYKCRGKL